MSYIPNPLDNTEPQASRTVESAALEFRSLKDPVIRSLRFPVTDLPANRAELPTAAARANRTLAFDPVTGAPIAGPTIQDIANAGTNATAAANSAAAAATSVTNAANSATAAANSAASVNATGLQNSTPQWLTGITGTNNITGSLTPAITAYAAGQTFRFIAVGANTGAATININGLGVRNITREGTIALVAGDIPAGAVCQIVFDGTQFQLQALSRTGGRLLRITRYGTPGSGTWTRPADTVGVLIKAVGAGGSGASATTPGQNAAGGGSGGYCEIYIAPAAASYPFTVGAGGAAVGGDAHGNAGGSTTIAGMTAGGGGGGAFGNNWGAHGGTASGGTLNLHGSPGTPVFTDNTNFRIGGQGGRSQLGPGGNTGGSGQFGGGGGGQAGHGGGSGAGGNGYIEIWEFS